MLLLYKYICLNIKILFIILSLTTVGLPSDLHPNEMVVRESFVVCVYVVVITVVVIGS